MATWYHIDVPGVERIAYENSAAVHRYASNDSSILHYPSGGTYGNYTSSRTPGTWFRSPSGRKIHPYQRLFFQAYGYSTASEFGPCTGNGNIYIVGQARLNGGAWFDIFNIQGYGRNGWEDVRPVSELTPRAPYYDAQASYGAWLFYPVAGFVPGGHYEVEVWVGFGWTPNPGTTINTGISDVATPNGEIKINYDFTVDDGVPLFEPGVPEPTPTPELTYVSTTASLGHVDILFSDSLAGIYGTASLPTSWVVTNTDDSTPLAVNAVSFAGSTVTLDTDEQKTGANYSVVIPNLVVGPQATLRFAGPSTKTFVGVGQTPTVLNIGVQDARNIIVYFSEEVVEAEALTATNYAADNGLTISASVKISPTIYRLTTSRQTTGTAYTVTATGIHDLAGNIL